MEDIPSVQTVVGTTTVPVSIGTWYVRTWAVNVEQVEHAKNAARVKNMDQQ